MSIDDPIEVHLEHLKKDLDTGIESALTDATVASILSLIPWAGSAIQSLLDGRVRENVQRRSVELFVEMKRRIEEIDAFRDDYSLMLKIEVKNWAGRHSCADAPQPTSGQTESLLQLFLNMEILPVWLKPAD